MKHKKMTEKEFNKFMVDVRSDFEGDHQNKDLTDCAGDIAESILIMHPEVKEYVKNEMPSGATYYDMVSYVAESIYK